MPVGATAAGRTRLSDGDDQSRKILRLALSDDSNNNAFQQNISLGSRMIFNPKTEATRAVILRRLQTIFDGFEQARRFQLVRESIQWGDDAEGQLTLTFRYVDLETEQEQELTQTFGEM